jgi:hypothetical protein
MQQMKCGKLNAAAAVQVFAAAICTENSFVLQYA